MATIAQTPLFAWDQIDAASDLHRFYLVLVALPDSALMKRLELRRGRGRNDYPVRAMWNAFLAGIVFQHPSAASLLRELRRNAELRQACGFDVHLGAEGVPTENAFSRFVRTLVEVREGVEHIFKTLIDALSDQLPSLGEKIAVDSKAIPTFSKPTKRDAANDEGPKEDGRRDDDANWGMKTPTGQKKEGGSWTKTHSWFGYKLHLLVDSVYELPLAYKVDRASSHDMNNLLPLVDDVEEHHPKIHSRCKELTADKGYDSANNNRILYEDHNIKPVIDKRTMWRGDPTKALYDDRADVIIYDEEGNVSCVCPVSGEVREMAFTGFEKDRKTLKYRCPAAAGEYECAGRKACDHASGGSPGVYGRVVRVLLEKDRRVFTPIARPTDKWAKAYARRTAVERVNARIDTVLGFEKHNIRGQAKMEMRLGMALVVQLAMALGRIKAQQTDALRSLVRSYRAA